MKPGAAATIAERIKSHNRASPYFTVEQASGGWDWKVHDPRARTPQGDHVVVAQGSAESQGHAHVQAHAAVLRATAPRR